MFSQEMSPKDLDQALSWCHEQGLDLIILGGGEPTMFRDYHTLLALAIERKMRVWLTSNTLYPPEIIKLIHPGQIELFVSHFDQDVLSRDANLAQRYQRNLHFAVASGIEVILRYTMTERSGPHEWESMLNLAAEYGIEIINFAFAFRKFRGNNEYVKYVNGSPNPMIEGLLLKFTEACRQRGLKPHLCKPFPLCIVSAKQLEIFLRNGTLHSACTAPLRRFTQNLTINPDLSTFPCNAIGFRGPTIKELGSLEAAGEYYSGLLRALLQNPFFEKCKDCFYHYRGLCQAVCLAEHFAQLEKKGAFRLETLDGQQV